LCKTAFGAASRSRPTSVTRSDGHDMRRAPIEERKATLAKLLAQPPGGIGFNEHYSGDGAIIYRHAAALGCEGIVSKRLAHAIVPLARSVG
jgi:ATP-dependent DNA ligase